MSDNERFVTFTAQGVEHTCRITDIQVVGVGRNEREQSYVQLFGHPLSVPREEAIRVRELWLREG